MTEGTEESAVQSPAQGTARKGQSQDWNRSHLITQPPLLPSVPHDLCTPHTSTSFGRNQLGLVGGGYPEGDETRNTDTEIGVKL